MELCVNEVVDDKAKEKANVAAAQEKEKADTPAAE
jgi:hypothetical protein